MTTSFKQGQKVKFTVSSAQEAVKHIREQLGPNAKVLSVRQIEGKGLAKFLTAPKLEVIATIESPDGSSQTVKVDSTGAQKSQTSFSPEEKSLLQEDAATETIPAPAKPAAANVRSSATSAPSQNRLLNILQSAGFDASVIRRFENSTDWEKLQRVPLKTALNDLARRLTIDFHGIDIPAPTQNVAFLGTSGSGKTTALCKQLTHEVFFEQRNLQVFKLDADTPNADTALSLYCEVMGVPFLRDSAKIETKSAMLVDTPGVVLGATQENLALKKRLDELKVDTRIWVINAAYDKIFIDQSLATAEELGCTHTVFTHLDEISTTARLWQFLLSGNMPPIFGCNGPAVSHDRISDMGPFMIQKTFPEYLLK